MLRIVSSISTLVCAAAVTVSAQMPPLPEVPVPSPTPNAEPQVGSPERADATAEGETERTWQPHQGQQTWEEFLKDWLTPRKVKKSVARRIDDHYAYPHIAVSIKMEIVDEDDTYLWLRGIPPEDPESPLHDLWLTRQTEEQLIRQRADWEREHGPVDYWLDFSAEIVPPPFVDSLTFTSHDTGLPSLGLWQMNFVRDDIDEDGIDDLVFPPPRKGSGQPVIYKGLPDSGYRMMTEAGWLRGIPYDYGGIATGDFDGDGHRDIVLAIHFKQQYVLYGDGTGAFPRSERLKAPDPRMTSRACTVADFDGNGRDDIAFIAELDLDMGSQQRIEGAPTVWVLLNTESGWQLVEDGLPFAVISDDLEHADIDGDGRVDLVLGSNTSNWRSLVYLNRVDGWARVFSSKVLSGAIHFDVEPVMRPDGTSEIYAAFMQYRHVGGTNQARTGLIRYEWTGNELVAPDGAITFDDDRTNPYVRVGAGDLNGDGLTDLVSGRKAGGLEVWIGTGAGEFMLEQSPEIDTVGRAYDIQLVDLNGDGRDDILAAFAPAGDTSGGVRLWLTGDATE